MFTVFEDATGWFISGRGLIGPLPSKERAIDLAEGMAWAVVSTGHVAEVTVETRSWAPANGERRSQPSAPEKPRYRAATALDEIIDRSGLT